MTSQQSCSSKGQGHVWEYSHNDLYRKCKDCNHVQIKAWIDVPRGVTVQWE